MLKLWPGRDEHGGPTLGIALDASLPEGRVSTGLSYLLRLDAEEDEDPGRPLQRIRDACRALARVALRFHDRPWPCGPAEAARLVGAGVLEELLDMGCPSALGRAAENARRAGSDARLVDALVGRLLAGEVRTSPVELIDLTLSVEALEIEWFEELRELADEPPVLCLDGPRREDAALCVLGELRSQLSLDESYYLAELDAPEADGDASALITEAHIRRFCEALVDER